MNYLYYLSAALVICIIMCCQDIERKPIIFYEDGRISTIKVSIPDSQKYCIINFYPGGNIKSHYYESDGSVNGLLTMFYDNGIVKTQEYQKNGLVEGRSELYYPTGELMQISHYHEGKAHGDAYVYQKDGSIKALHKSVEGVSYFKRIWEYNDEGDISDVHTIVNPAILLKDDKNVDLLDSLVMTFNIPLDDAEFEQEYFRMDAIIRIWQDGQVNEEFALRDISFESGIYEFGLDNPALLDSIEVKPVIRYIKNEPGIVYDTIDQLIILRGTEGDM